MPPDCVKTRFIPSALRQYHRAYPRPAEKTIAQNRRIRQVLRNQSGLSAGKGQKVLTVMQRVIWLDDAPKCIAARSNIQVIAGLFIFFAGIAAAL